MKTGTHYVFDQVNARSSKDDVARPVQLFLGENKELVAATHVYPNAPADENVIGEDTERVKTAFTTQAGGLTLIAQLAPSKDNTYDNIINVVGPQVAAANNVTIVPKNKTGIVL